MSYLTGPVATGREGYYTSAVETAGEPAGRWWGTGAAELGLAGEVDPALLEAMFTHHLDPRDERAHDRSTWGEAEQIQGRQKAYRSPEQIYAGKLADHPGASPEERADMWTAAQTAARQNVEFTDVTFSPAKSVSVAAAAFEAQANEARRNGDEAGAEMWEERVAVVEAAVMAGASATLEYLEEHAGYSRAGHHGGGSGRWVDAHRFVVAQFLQHDSRERDPQLHVHQGMWNKVQCDDGVWRAPDGRAIRLQLPAAAAVGERVMEAELFRTVGLVCRDRADGHGREVVGVSEAVNDLFSKRTMAITPRAAEMVRRFEEQMGRPASPLERARIGQDATLVTRPAKSHVGESATDRADRWAQEAREEVDGGLAEVAHAVLNQPVEGPAEWSVTDVVERAVASLDLKRQSWTEADMVQAVSDALPANLGVSAAEVPQLLRSLAQEALGQTIRTSPDPATSPELPEELRRLDGSSQYVRPGATKYSSPEQLAGEAALRAAAVLRGAALVSPGMAQQIITRLAASGRELGVDQAAAVRGVLTSGAQLQVLAAPAGSGKSFVVGAIADAMRDAGAGRVIGLAPSQVAANILAEDGLDAMNTTAWLGGRQRPDLAPRSGDLVVVDEAGMASNSQVLEIRQRCADAGASMLLVGDPRQLTSVGPGGAMADLQQRGVTYGLTEVRRFQQEWERAASLQLRDGDAAGLEQYDRHGRLMAGGTAEQAQSAAGRAWLADTLVGKDSLLLVGSNEAAASLSAQMRAELVRLGKVEELGVSLDRQGTVAGIGDLIQARHNGWDLIGVDGNEQAPLNRSTYRVTGLRDDQGLIVAPVVGRDETGQELFGDALQLPRGYTSEHVDLAYASTTHAAQGRTVDTGHDLVGSYVGMTRGRESNTAWLTTVRTAPGSEYGEAQTVEERTGVAVMTGRLSNVTDELTALAEREQLELEARSTQTHVGQLIDGVSHVTTGRTAAILDRLTAEGALPDHIRTELAADSASGSLDRLLRTAELAGHDPEQTLRTAVADRDFKDVRSAAQVLHGRITGSLHGQLTPQIGSAHDLIPADTPESWRPWLTARADAADARRNELGGQLAESAPPWAVDALGPVPHGVVERADWEHRAGWAGAWREMSGHDDETDPLGSAPPAGLVENSAMFRAGHAALDLPDATAEEAELSDGRLRVRVTAMEREEKWAPRYVGDDLAAAHRTVAERTTDATMFEANAQIEQDEIERDQLECAARDARAEAWQAEVAAGRLELADQARADWFIDSAATREIGERARIELSARGVDLTKPDDLTTAPEWLEQHQAYLEEQDTRPELAEVEVVDTDEQDELQDTADDIVADPATPSPETAVPDIRDTAVADPKEHAVEPPKPERVPRKDEVTETTKRAQEATAEITARRDDLARREEEDAATRAYYEKEAVTAAPDTSDAGDSRADDDVAV